LLPVLATNQQQLEFNSLSRWILSSIWSTLSPIQSTFADTVDFVASVYRAKAIRSTTLSTFNKVDRVEFIFVASVYRAKAIRSTTLSTFSKVDRVEFNFVASVFRSLNCWWLSGCSIGRLLSM